MEEYNYRWNRSRKILNISLDLPRLQPAPVFVLLANVPKHRDATFALRRTIELERKCINVRCSQWDASPIPDFL
jgi:hypothetical protein